MHTRCWPVLLSSHMFLPHTALTLPPLPAPFCCRWTSTHVLSTRSEA